MCVHGCRLLVISMASSLLAMGGAPPSSLLATTRHEEEGGAGDASGIHAEEQTPCLRLALDIQAGGTICDLGKLLDQYMKENSIQLGPVKVKTEKPKRAPTPVSAPDSSLQGPTGDPATPTRKRVKQISKKQARIQPTLVSSGTVTVADGAMMDLEESRTIDMMDDGIEGDNTFEQKRDGADESDDDMPIEDEADAEEYRRKRTGVVEIIEQRFQRFVAGNMNSSEEEEEAGGEVALRDLLALLDLLAFEDDLAVLALALDGFGGAGGSSTRPSGRFVVAPDMRLCRNHTSSPMNLSETRVISTTGSARGETSKANVDGAPAVYRRMCRRRCGVETTRLNASVSFVA